MVVTAPRNLKPASAVPEFERDIVAECLGIAKTMGAYVEVIGQRKARGSGTTEGVTDTLVFCAGNVIAAEFKRADGTVNMRQHIAAERRFARGVKTPVIRSADEFVRLLNWCKRHCVREHGLPEGMETVV